MTWEIYQADAHDLPWGDEHFDVIVADPPYSGRNRGKTGVGSVATGYVAFKDRDWFHEALRVLKPSGSLYIVAGVREIHAWSTIKPTLLVDVIAWYAPNAVSTSAWRRSLGGRAPAWRPIFHFQKPPQRPIEWVDGFVKGNFVEKSLVQRPMAEARNWPNQMPEAVLRWLLSPHQGVVLDLFAGTGTTGAMAVSLGLNAVSVELSDGGVKEVKRRMAAQQPPLLVAEDGAS